VAGGRRFAQLPGTRTPPRPTTAAPRVIQSTRASPCATGHRARPSTAANMLRKESASDDFDDRQSWKSRPTAPSDSRQNANVRILRPVVVKLKAWVAPAHVFSWQPPQVYAANFVHLHGSGFFHSAAGAAPHCIHVE